jgi:methionyl-tRNA formyltransferase
MSENKKMTRSMQLRTVFMGSPEFALPALRRLAAEYQVVGVVTQPDRPAGRGRVLTPPPVKILAQELNMPVIQPRRLSEPEALQKLHHWAPDLIVVAAFGQILRPVVLDLPKYGCINVHASLLPRWRGAAPIQAAILNGDEYTGITIMRMDPGIDTGPTLRQKSLPISHYDTAGTLSEKLSQLGADLLIDTIPAYLSGRIVLQAQDDSLASYAPMIKKEDGLLDFSLPAIALDRKIRAFNPWPGAFNYWNDQVLKIHYAHVIDHASDIPGKHLIIDEQPAITTGQGILVLDKLQLAGRKIQSGQVFLRGVRNWEG